MFIPKERSVGNRCDYRDCRDDSRIAQIHEKFIEHLDGFNVIGKAINAKDTISLLEKRQPDSLLLDIYMPDELYLLPLRGRFPSVDIIITASAETRLLQEALRSGVSHYVIKPVSAHKFTEVLLQYREKENGCAHSRS